MEEHFRRIIEILGEDPTRDGLKRTPLRAAEAMQFLTKGYHTNLDQIVNGALFPSDADEMVIVQDIEIFSLCEHHLLPFFGKCHVGYVPNGQVIGLSKIARIADAFARRLQIQETLTSQIADAIQHYTGAKGVAVVVEAQHLCMMMRGVEKQHSLLKTSCMLGCLKTDHTQRMEFLRLITS